MNAEKRKQLDSFTQYVAKLALDAIKATGGVKITNKDFTQILLDNKETLTMIYGEELISFSSPYLLKRHTKGVQLISANRQLDFGDELMIPEYFTVDEKIGERVPYMAGTFEDFEKHNQVLRHKAQETMTKFHQLEDSRIYLLSLVGGNSKAMVADAIDRIISRNAA